MSERNKVNNGFCSIECSKVFTENHVLEIVTGQNSDEVIWYNNPKIKSRSALKIEIIGFNDTFIIQSVRDLKSESKLRTSISAKNRALVYYCVLIRLRYIEKYVCSESHI